MQGISPLLRRLIYQSPAPPGNVIGNAVLGYSPDDHMKAPVYRYDLRRWWDMSKATLLYVMLNPSTADSNVDDPTIRVCIGRAAMMGFGSIRVVNLFAFRAISPRELYDHVQARNVDYIIGPENDDYIHRALKDMGTGAVLCAWGGHGSLAGRGKTVKQMIIKKGWEPLVIGLTGAGDPLHPLRQSYNTEAIPWK